MPPLTNNQIDEILAREREDMASVAEWGYDSYEDDDWRDGVEPAMFATFTLQDGVREATQEEWMKYFTTQSRRIATTNVESVVISTTFLGINLGGTKPLWFESMVFGGGLDGFSEHYATLEDALRGHETIVLTIKEAYRDARKVTPIERVRRNNVVR